MSASLPMYDLPELRAATDAWWSSLGDAFRGAGVENVPARLSLDEDVNTLWRRPELLFSQTCGYPLTHALGAHLRLVATPVYAAPGCDGPLYCSVLVVGATREVSQLAELRNGVCAINAEDSQSGYNCLRYMIAPLAESGRFFSNVIKSGSHADSIALVASGQADVCAVDCVTHALLSRHRPRALDGTRVLCRSPRTPGLPYVTSAGATDDLVQRLRDGLMTAFADPGLADSRDALLLSGVEILSRRTYQGILDMEDAARAAGYPDLR